MAPAALSRPMRLLLTRRPCRTFTTGAVAYEALPSIPSVGKLVQLQPTPKEKTLVVHRLSQLPLGPRQLPETLQLLELL